jgi:hypothetical protein
VDRSRASVRRLVLAVFLAAAASACQVRTVVTVDVGDDGSGTVEVAAGLDKDALSKIPDLDDNGTSDAADLEALVRTDDLLAAGWKVDKPSRHADGTTWITVTRPFGTPEEANQILAQLTGPRGALRHLHVSRRDPFGRTQFGLSGLVDLRRGLEAFGDDGLADDLEGNPLGEDPAAIEKRTGQPLADSFRFKLVARLPGHTRSWSPRLGDPPVRLDADGTVYHWPALILALVAAACAIALVLLTVRRALQRATGREAEEPAPSDASASDAKS